MTSVLHVATTGSDSGDGSADRPFRTINRAASLAQAGDTVVVHEGEYREWVRPRRGGLSDQRRITYQAAAGEHVVSAARIDEEEEPETAAEALVGEELAAPELAPDDGATIGDDAAAGPEDGE